MPSPSAGSARLTLSLTTLLSLVVVAYAVRYLAFDPATYFPQQREVFARREVLLGLHIGGGMLALAIGPFQFWARLRRGSPRLHRVLGAGYVAGVAVGGLAGLAMATTAHGGPLAQAGFASLALAWLVTTGIALRMVLAGRVGEHRRWMVRSFALTFAAVTLRLLLGVHGVLQAGGLIDVEFATAYAAIAWLCWVPNLLLALWLTRQLAPAAAPPAAGRAG